ncbi:MAG: hypothetical protein WEA82_11115 [Idiomarina sp.]
MRYPWLRELWLQLLDDARHDRLAHAHCVPWRLDAASDVLIGNLSQWLLCQQPTSKACGTCKSCLLMKAGNHPDLIEVGDAEQASIGVDQIRKLTQQLSQTANQSGRKLAVIKYADKLTLAAANALLKTLEEPTANTFLVLAAERPMQLLPTLRSRMRMHRFPSFVGDELKQWLEQYGEQPLAADDAILRAWPEAPLKALAQLQQRSDSGKTTEHDPVAELWAALMGQGVWPGLTDKDNLGAWLDASEFLMQDLVRIKQHIQPLRLHTNEVATANDWLMRQNVSLASLNKHIQAIQRVRQQQQQQSGLNGRLLLRDQWLRWPSE